MHSLELVRTLLISCSGLTTSTDDADLSSLPAVPPKDDHPARNDVKEHEQRSLDRSAEFQKTGRAYAIAHATRPGTIGENYLDLSSKLDRKLIGCWRLTGLTVGSSPISLLSWREFPIRWTGFTVHRSLTVNVNSRREIS